MKEKLKKLKNKLLKNNEIEETKQWIIEQINEKWTDEMLKEKIDEVNFIASFGPSNKKIEVTEESYKYDLLRQYADFFTEEERQNLRNIIAGINLKTK